MAFSCLLSSLLLSSVAVAASSAGSELVSSARELVDTYYGDRSNLEEATVLLAKAYAMNPKDANVFVQAARITVMGGSMPFGTFQGGTIERYAALLDRAIELDPSNAKAHILKAEVFDQQGRPNEQLIELDKAKSLRTVDPWLQIGYGRYYKKINARLASYTAYADVQKRGPGSSASERRAYVTAIGALKSFLLVGERAEEKLRKHAALALAARYPTDAWTPLGYAEDFIDYQLFEEAIVYAREALNTMEFRAARMTLASALYARAAQLKMAKHPSAEVEPLLVEARKFDFSKSDLLEYLLVRRGFGDSLRILEPTLNEIIR